MLFLTGCFYFVNMLITFIFLLKYIEIKITELKKEHIGQIQVYMNYIGDNLKKISQDKTLGIIICKQDNKYVIKYCSDDRIVAKEYELV